MYSCFFLFEGHQIGLVRRPLLT